MSSAQAGAIRYNRVRATRHRALRVAIEDRNSLILLNRVTSGRVRVTQDGREAELRAGDFAIHTAARPYELAFDTSFSQLIFQIPRSLFEQRVGRFDHLTAVAISGADPLGRLASNFLVDLVHTAPYLDPVVATRISMQALDLVAAAMLSPVRKGAAPCSTSAHRAALLYRVKAHIESHLGERLTASDVAAAALGCSVRYVHSLFADEATCFGDYLLSRRLNHCAADLARGLPRRPIGEIAYAWGFTNASHFCRSFRQCYGVSPSRYREQSAALAADGESGATPDDSILGLFTARADLAESVGGSYPGGRTRGPAITFAYLSARRPAAGREETGPPRAVSRGSGIVS